MGQWEEAGVSQLGTTMQELLVKEPWYQGLPQLS
jgi:hypothetical protein